MAYDFPNSPTVGQIFPTSGPGQQWQWDGTKWVAYNVASGGATVIISDTAPAGPTTGTLWFDSLGTQMYIYESDGNSSQWVPVVNQGGALTLAAATNVGRNYLHNSLFNVQQRGAGNFNASGYTADRWMMIITTDTSNISLAALSDAQRVSIGDEAATQSLIFYINGNAAAGALSAVQQRIENVRRLAGKTITVSFWAWCGSGALKLGVSVDQLMGTGGSPSADVLGAGQSVTLSTTPTRYSLTFAIPSLSGKTLGTNGNDNTALTFWGSSGATNATRSGNVGVQTGAIGLWGMQLELGNAATPLEKIDPQQDLARCQRFYCTGGIVMSVSNQAAGGSVQGTVTFPVTMRNIPQMAVGTNSSTNLSSFSWTAWTPQHGYTGGVATAAGQVAVIATYTASADL